MSRSSSARRGALAVLLVCSGLATIGPLAAASASSDAVSSSTSRPSALAAAALGSVEVPAVPSCATQASGGGLNYVIQSAPASPNFGDPTFRVVPCLAAVAAPIIAEYQSDLGTALTLKPVIGLSARVDAGADADADPQTASGAQNSLGPYCVIRFSTAPGMWPTFDVSEVEVVLAHELFHCFEFQLAPVLWTSDGKWIIEGLAEWAAETVSPIAGAAGQGFLQAYLQTPGASVLARAYSAAFFWGHVQDTNHDLWHRIKQILNAGSNSASYVAAGANTWAFLSTWGSSVFRLAGDPGWEMSSPVLNPTGAGEAPDQISGDATVTAPPFATAQYVLTVPLYDSVVHAAINGPANLSQHYSYTHLANSWFCTATSCECPTGTVSTLPGPLRPLEPVADLGMAGQMQHRTVGTITSYPLSDFCTPKSSAPLSGVLWQGAQRTGAIPAGKSLTFGHVSCPPGESVLGGGYLTNGRAYATSSVVLSLPGPSGNAWGAEAANPEFLGQPGPFVITVDCLGQQHGGAGPPVTGFVTSAPTKSGPLKAGVTERGTASCPAAGGSGAGWFVTGGGFALGSAVTAYPVDSFAPSDGSWAATAYNNGSGIPGTMSVQADCMQLLRKAGARPITGIRLQTAVSPQVAVRHDQVASVSERCPSGFTVVSGGWWLDDEVIDANSAPHVIASRALNSRTWGVTVLNPPSGASPTAFAVLAVCAKPQR